MMLATVSALPSVSFTGVAIVAAAAFAVPLLLGLVPALRIPAVVLEIVIGIVLGPSVLGWVREDTAIHVISLMGLAALLFLAGLELELPRLRGHVLRITGTAYVLSLALGLLVGYGLKAAGVIIDPPLIAIVLASTSLGVVIPVLKDADQASTDFGQLVIAAASLAEVIPIILLSLFFSNATANLPAQLLTLGFLLLFAAAATFSVTQARRVIALTTVLRRLEDTTAQIRIRGIFVLLATLGALAIQLGIEGILGAFLAGAVLNLSDPGDTMPGSPTRLKLDAIGFGVFIPFFFITTGLQFQLSTLVGNPAALLRVPLFLVALLVVRGAPALLYMRHLGPRRALAAGLFQATSLSFIVVAVSLGEYLGLMRVDTGSALIATGLLSALLFPLGALLSLSPGPA
jgi:Kef-type K+ transport system membrane component KefB